MDSGKKAAIGGTLVFLLVIGGYSGYLYHERHKPVVMKVPEREVMDQDDLVFLKHKRPSNPGDLKDLYGTTVWISAASQLDYYPVSGKTAQYGKKAGTLLGAEALKPKSAIEQVAPKTATFRVPGGDKQVLLVFTLPASSDPNKEYAVPVGYRENGSYTFMTDDIFFYDDPHELYKHWGPKIWEAVDSHQVILGMNERQVDLALGQVKASTSQEYGNRLVIYSNLGHPMAVTFVKNKVTAFRPDQGY